MKKSVRIKNLHTIQCMALLQIVAIFLNKVPFVSSLYSNDAYHHKHTLGPDGNYTLEWTVYWESKTIVFNVSAECKGYIGLGLSKTGSISGSDFVIGGIDSSGKSYLSDMHGLSNGTLKEDYRHDWTLLDIRRGNGRIHLSFSRPFETCDDEDYSISKDLIHVIWVYGDTDEITLFSPHQGNHAFYLLDPDLTTQTANNIYRQIGPHSNLYLMQQWRAIARQKVPSQEDSRLCSIIKGPQLNNKHFILGGGAYLPNDDSSQLVRQIILNRCIPPEGKNAAITFDSLLNREGYECSSFHNSTSLPKHLCTEVIFVWGFGGKPYYFPEEIGIPIGMSSDEYYMLEVQYHNPGRLENLNIKTGLELMFHPRPKKYEGGVLLVNYGLHGLFTIPPRSAAFNIYGHCSSQCTKDIFLAKDMRAFAVLFQMGRLGKMVRLRHFHGAEELPWILNDDNYNHTYQQVRLLSREATILPGDQLTLQCTYDSLMISNATFSGFSNNQEQCIAYIFVNQRIKSAWCSSEYPMGNQMQYLGIPNKNVSRSSTQRNPPLAPVRGLGHRPSENASTLTDKNIQWSPSARAALQRDMLHGSQRYSCPLHQKMATFRRAHRFPLTTSFASRRTRNEIVAIPATFQSFSTPFAGDSVTIPNISLEYRPSSECQRTSGPVNNFGYHRNVVGKFKSNPIISSVDDNPPGKGEYKSNIKSIVPRYRRLNLNG